MPGDDVFDALAWLIWPSDGLEEALEAGALRILSVESQAKGDSVDQATATWSVTVKLTDVEALRRLAVRAFPDEAAQTPTPDRRASPLYSLIFEETAKPRMETRSSRSRTTYAPERAV